jgi:hypothetical protein
MSSVRKGQWFAISYKTFGFTLPGFAIQTVGNVGGHRYKGSITSFPINFKLEREKVSQKKRESQAITYLS